MLLCSKTILRIGLLKGERDTIAIDMNPEAPQLQPRPEIMPQMPVSGEAYQSPEVAIENHETMPQAAPQEVINPIPPVLPTVPAMPMPAQPVVQDDTSTPSVNTPSVASDDDLIEKEWVDKLKSIITLTAGDPHERAKVVAQLQADYLKKRYNKNIGQASE